MSRVIREEIEIIVVSQPEQEHVPTPPPVPEFDQEAEIREMSDKMLWPMMIGLAIGMIIGSPGGFFLMMTAGAIGLIIAASIVAAPYVKREMDRKKY